MSEKLEISSEVREAISEVRNDKSKVNFCVVGYDTSDAKKLVLFGKGGDGVIGLKTFVKEEDVNYCLLRVDFNYETVGVIKTDQSRFVFVYVRPEKLNLKRKMMIGSVEGQIKKLFSPFIRTVEVDSIEEVTEEKITEFVDTITMTKSKVTDNANAMKGAMFISGRMVTQRNAADDSQAAKLAPDSRANFAKVGGAEVKFENEDQLKEAIAAVRSDSDPTRWCLYHYVDKKTLAYKASGEGDVSELLANCADDAIAYGLFRFVEQYGKIGQVKFGFVTWVPDGISPIMKAVVSTHKGVVVEKFRPFHVQFYVQDRAELTEAKALDAISSVTGMKSHVTDKKAVVKEEKYERKFVGGTTSDVQKLQFTDKEAFDEAVKEVRSDSNETDWALAKFDGDKKNLKLALVGSGIGIQSLLEAVVEDAVQYMLVRTTVKVDNYDTTKFSLFKYEGVEVGIGYKGACGVLHGAVTSSFGSVHTSGELGSKDELAKKLQ